MRLLPAVCCLLALAACKKNNDVTPAPQPQPAADTITIIPNPTDDTTKKPLPVYKGLLLIYSFEHHGGIAATGGYVPTPAAVLYPATSAAALRLEITSTVDKQEKVVLSTHDDVFRPGSYPGTDKGNYAVFGGFRSATDPGKFEIRVTKVNGNEIEGYIFGEVSNPNYIYGGQPDKGVLKEGFFRVKYTTAP